MQKSFDDGERQRWDEEENVDPWTHHLEDEENDLSSALAELRPDYCRQVSCIHIDGILCTKRMELITSH